MSSNERQVKGIRQEAKKIDMSRSGTILVGADRNHMRVIYNECRFRPRKYAGYIGKHIEKFGYGPVMKVLMAHNWAEIYPEAESVEKIGRPAGSTRYFTTHQFPADATAALLISNSRIDYLRKTIDGFYLYKGSAEQMNRRGLDIAVSTMSRVEANGEVIAPEPPAVEPEVTATEPVAVEPAEPMPLSEYAMDFIKFAIGGASTAIITRDGDRLVVETDKGALALSA